MNNAVFYSHYSPGPFFSGHITGQTGDRFHVFARDTTIRASRASGCLLFPAIGDRVLIFSEDQEHFILTVLSRNAHAGMENEVVFDGPARIRANEGDLQLQSEREIHVAAKERIHFASDEIRAHASKAHATIDQCSVFGRMLRVQVEVVKTAARVMDHLVKRWTLRADNSVRYIRKHEEVQAGSARHLTEKTLTMHSKNAVHTAEELVSINGGQINLS